MTIKFVDREDIINDILDSLSDNGTLTDEQKQILEDLSKDDE
jgi:hypothetical protein